MPEPIEVFVQVRPITDNNRAFMKGMTLKKAQRSLWLRSEQRL
jgi:hypothetical protein